MLSSTLAETKAAWADEDALLRIYLLDKEARIDFDTKLEKANLSMLFMIPHLWVCMPCICVSCLYIDSNVRDAVEAEHMALTQDGIRHKTEKHKTGLRCDCMDQGATSKTIPFDRVQDVMVEEPAGSSGPCCCLVENTLTTVQVQTAGSAGAELVVRGLMDPKGFRNTVLALKRGQPMPETGKGAIDIDVPMVAAPFGGSGMGSSTVPGGVGGIASVAPMPTGGMASGSGNMEALMQRQIQLLESIDATLKAQGSG